MQISFKNQLDIMQAKIWLSSPHMGGNDRKFVTEAFDTNWVAPLGPHVNGLEKDIARFLLPAVTPRCAAWPHCPLSA